MLSAPIGTNVVDTRCASGLYWRSQGGRTWCASGTSVRTKIVSTRSGDRGGLRRGGRAWRRVTSIGTEVIDDHGRRYSRRVRGGRRRALTFINAAIGT